MHPLRRAFTLIELLVVILIIAVVSAIIVPQFSGYYDKSKFDAEVRRIQDYVALAREKAVKSDMTVTLHFERGAHEFMITADPLPMQNDLPTAMQTPELAEQQGAAQDVPPYRIGSEYQVDGFTVTANANSQSATSQTDVHFNGDGTSDGLELHLVSDRGYTAHLSLAPTTGQMTLGAAQ